MPDDQVRVMIEPHGRAAYVLSGTKALEAAARAGLVLDTPCGGQGTCGKCRVRIPRGACPPTPPEERIFTPEQLKEGWRLACQTALCREAILEVPAGSLFAGQQQILREARTGRADEVLPAVRKAYVELPQPSLEDPEADLLRLQRACGPVRGDVEMLRVLARLLREGGFRGTAVMADHRLIDFEPGDTTGRCFGAAFDIGTTTLVGCLIDLCSGDEAAVESRINPQVRFGDDVLSRIRHASDAGGLEDLRSAVVAAANEMLAELCRQAGAARREVYEVAFAGNTTMQQLLCGIDPSPLGQVPFVPAVGGALMAPAGELGIAIHPRGAAVVFPVIGGFVGGDTVAGMLATRLVEDDCPAMLVDIGTNGEIVLARDGRIWAASTAAGPAFEGARISCGMRAAAGAIEKVVFDDDLRFSAIGNAPPIGLCGSALVDLTAELLRGGLVTASGRLLPPEDLPAGLPEALRRRIQRGADGQISFLVAAPPPGGLAGPAGPAAGGIEVRLTQRDVREVQLATGAIRAGVQILLRLAGVDLADLERILLAGGFGSFIRRSNAQRIGLLPIGIDHRRIHYVGNTSLGGAKWALVSTKARRRAEELARLAQHVELSRDPAFQEAFAEAMIFPQEGSR